MGFYAESILPRAIDWVMRGEEFQKIRRRYLGACRGTVLEVGFGSGLNLPHYPAEVTRLYALDPARLGRKLAAERLSRAPFPVEFLDLQNTRIPLPDEAVDTVVTTWTLCTIPKVRDALQEMMRVLIPAGRYVFVEHGLSPEPGVARWQNRLTPLQKCLAGGCHLNRKIDALITGAGFRIESLDTFYFPAPRIFAWTYAGHAVKPPKAA